MRPGTGRDRQLAGDNPGGWTLRHPGVGAAGPRRRREEGLANPGREPLEFGWCEVQELWRLQTDSTGKGPLLEALLPRPVGTTPRASSLQAVE